MKRVWLACCVLSVVFGVGAGAALAQEKPKPADQEVDANPLTDVVLEIDAKKNLKAAQLYFTRKAYVGALQRCEETIAVYQRFKKFDEVLYIAGMSSLRLARKEGKQPPTLAPEKYLVLARDYLTQLVNEHPKSSFRKRAEEELQTIGDPKP
jgi:outer membrane protein assembly factor BamD (BamD/ComL family)